MHQYLRQEYETKKRYDREAVLLTYLIRFQKKKGKNNEQTEKYLQMKHGFPLLSAPKRYILILQGIGF
jgi:hypothetical protein